MNEWADGFPGTLVSDDTTLDAEFEERLRDSGTLAFRVAYGVLRHREDAEDVAQEAFARAYRHFRELRDRERFRAWLVRTAWRLAIDRWRSDRRRAAREQVVHPAAPVVTTEDLAVSTERAAHLWRAIDALPEKLRIVVVLSAIEGHDVREVASLLQLPEGTVKSRLFLARRGLAEKLRCLSSSR
jgi:RNA polymerase sigma-70 factor (ECF subfamily)